MRNSAALKIAQTALQEIRLLLNRGNNDQALEVAEALRNLPIVETNRVQAKTTRQSINHYLHRHPDRKTLSHWQDIITYDDDYGIHDAPESPINGGAQVLPFAIK